MKKIIGFLFLVTTISMSASGQTVKIPADSAFNYIGKSVTICTKVYGGKSFEKMTLLNIGAKFPNSPVTIVIFQKNLANFPTPPLEMYSGKNICVTGKVELYKEKTEIIISSPEDITIEKQDEEIKTERD